MVTVTALRQGSITNKNNIITKQNSTVVTMTDYEQSNYVHVNYTMCRSGIQQAEQ